MALGFVFVPPIVGGVTYILQRSSPYIALYLWGFMLAVALFMMTIYPTVIQPLFNKFAPLEEGSLRWGLMWGFSVVFLMGSLAVQYTVY